MAKRIEDMGADSICIKDMAGLLVPYKATELVQALKEGSSLPIQLHTHYTSGVASMTYMKAVEAGCDIIDTAISPLALGTSQPATEVMAKTFEGTPYDPGFDQNLLAEIADYFRPLRGRVVLCHSIVKFFFGKFLSLSISHTIHDIAKVHASKIMFLQILYRQISSTVCNDFKHWLLLLTA